MGCHIFLPLQFCVQRAPGQQDARKGNGGFRQNREPDGADPEDSQQQEQKLQPQGGEETELPAAFSAQQGIQDQQCAAAAAGGGGDLRLLPTAAQGGVQVCLSGGTAVTAAGGIEQGFLRKPFFRGFGSVPETVETAGGELRFQLALLRFGLPKTDAAGIFAVDPDMQGILPILKGTAEDRRAA